MVNIVVGVFVLVVAGWMFGRALEAHDDGSPFGLWAALAVLNFALGAANVWIGFGGAA